MFRFISTAWQQKACVKASNTGSNDLLGRSVALDGDTLTVGAWREDSAAMGINGNQANNNAIDSSAIYIFPLIVR